MNYRIIFRDTFRLFRESKLLWILGAILFVNEVIFKVSVYSIGNPPVPCIAYPLFFISLYFSFIAKSSLTYSASQIVSEQKLTYSEVWGFSKTKLKRILWLYFLSIPLVMFTVFFPELVSMSEISALVTWLVEMLASFFLASLFAFSICAITINSLDPGLALWTGLTIVLNNFLHVFTLNFVFLILQVLLIVATGNAFFGILVLVPFTVTMTLAYQVFIAKDFYPALSNPKPTA